MEDSLVHQGLREKLVQEMKARGIFDVRVLTAMRVVPRHLFGFDEVFERRAYQDEAFPIDNSGQTVSHPYTVAFQSQLLSIQEGCKVLEIGTGSGYQAAVLAAMGASVYSIERIRSVYEKTRLRLQMLGYQVTTFLNDGNGGLPTYAPFDRIIITAAAPSIPIPLLKQLKIGGIMVVPVNNGDVQTMVRVTKLSETNFEQTTHGTFQFVPMLRGIEN